MDLKAKIACRLRRNSTRWKKVLFQKQTPIYKRTREYQKEIRKQETDTIKKINYETETPTVSARDLHEGLRIETPFKKWIDRMCEYGFESGKDFWTKMSESTGGRPATDYEISVDMAKQICMIQRSEKGRRYCKYFLIYGSEKRISW